MSLFACDECDRVFNRKENLKRHSRTHTDVKTTGIETPKPVSKKSFECPSCQKKYSSNWNLVRHMQHQHGPKASNKLADVESYECNECGGKFSSKRNIQRHLRSSLHEKGRLRRLPCLKCVNCNAEFHSRNLIIEHYQQAHEIHLQFEELSFRSFQEVEQWLSHHYHHSTAWVTSDYNVRRFRCHRSGFYQDACKKKNKIRQRSLKLVGSKKLQGFCPGEVTVRESRTDGSCLVSHQIRHIGHDVHSNSELHDMYLKHADKRNVTRQLKNGVPKETILKSINQNFIKTDDPSYQLDTVLTEDIANIQIDYEISEPFTVTNYENIITLYPEELDEKPDCSHIRSSPMKISHDYLNEYIDNICDNLKVILKSHIGVHNYTDLEVIEHQFLQPIEPTLLEMRKDPVEFNDV